MSASPSGQPNGATPKNEQPQFIRRHRATDPLRPRKRPLKRPLPSQIGTATKFPVAEATPLYPVNGLAPPRETTSIQNQAQALEANGGTTRRTTLPYRQIFRKKEVDPQNQNEFVRPVVLHRRDPQQPSGRESKDIEAGLDQPVDSKELEKQEIARAEKEKQRAIDMAQIAPAGNNPSALASKKVMHGRNEKTTQVYRLDKTEEEKKASDLRYEEALPWHIEDAENKNTWVGNYEAALSDINVAFVIKDGVFKMIPLEKWYKFTSKGQFKAYTIDEAEAKMSKKVKESRWVMKSNEQKEADRVNQESRKAMARLYTVKSESSTFKNSGKRETEDMDEIDFDGGELFQDDDELATVEPDKDEETKEAQERIKKEQLGANVFDQANEAEVDKEFIEEEKEAEVRKKFGKDVKKALKKRERNYIYDSDSDHPYSDASEDDTSDEEKVKEIDRRLEEENKSKTKTEQKVTSGAPKGTNPALGAAKNSDSSKKQNSRKRHGSPNLSESSGNESSRKKPKKKNQSQPHGSSIISSGSRQPNSNPTSDCDVAGEMSDEGKRRQRLKITMASGMSSGSRQASPGLQVTHPTAANSGPITTEEVIAALPVAGISIGNLMKSFGGRVGEDPVNQTKKADFIKLVRENAKFGPDKLLRPK
ncbi:transcription initiation factor IIF subunit alpha [Blumeria hordei DH14]|uniref:Transcription initiation factor IIF subunit alpha n=1 Tax=Blumeria graminis f. sp. hordei (strain DH14) TaxID=546991 RepID=N1JIH5_BLUG1|nr:transcription initiation factor IIF subunit alpha [Blumeria hordei DH14]